MSRGFSLSGYHMKLNRLKTGLPTLNTNKVKVLDHKAGATQRTRGWAWMGIRKNILIRDQYTCKCCGLVRQDHQVDHIVPLEEGGTDDESNLQTLCVSCHSAKTADEAKKRWKK